ncbi:MAG: hypothetical protein IJB98_00455, partial [Clostridia bacterium]|nr:hypothetical protein [Clostridia bacterium]
EMLMKRKYPFYVLHLNMPGDTVDVNVHPNKLDVRFENSGRIYSLFFEAVSRALDSMDYVALAEDKELNKQAEEFHNEKIMQKFSTLEGFDDVVVSEKVEVKPAPIIMSQKPTPKVDKAGVNLNPFSFDAKSLSKEEKQEYQKMVIDTASISASSSDSVKDGFGLGSKLLERLLNTEDSEIDEDYKDDTSSSSISSTTIKQEVTQEKLEILPSLKKIGKIFNTYLIIEVDDDVFFIDQHAAHERLLYERFKKEYDNKNVVVQPLLFPYVLSLNPLESNILEENLEHLKNLGFDIDEFGDNTYKISAVPSLVSEMNFDSFFNDFLAESKAVAKKGSELIKEFLMQKACKSAIKGGNDLSQNEINHLFTQMGKEKIALFCPHGRPIAIRISKGEIEKWFKRIV